MRWPIIALLFIGSLKSFQVVLAARIREKVKLQFDGSEEVRPSESYKVTLLVIRHGLSCANIVQNWVGKVDIGRGNIPDPELAAAAQHESYLAGEAISSWLAEHGISTIDATMASVLGRAVATSLMTFAKNFHDSTHQLEIVPFIRETGYQSKSNLPNPGGNHGLEQQIQTAMGKANITGYNMDFHWVNNIGALSPGDWSQFLDFLQNLYIPYTLTRLRKPPNSHLVLAVTTHGKLIGSYLGKKCSVDKKFLNNGVLHMEYMFHKVAPLNANMTVQFELEEDSEHFCNVLHEGMVLKGGDGKAKKICLADIGETCMNAIEAHAIWGKTMYKETIEHKILALANLMAHAKAKIDELQQDLALTLTKYTNANPGTADAKNAITKAKGLLSKSEQQFQILETDLSSIKVLKDTQCLSGDYPNMEKLLKEYRQLEIVMDASYWWSEAEPQIPARLQHRAPALLQNVLSEIANGTEYARCTSVLNEPHWILGIEMLESTCGQGLRCYDDSGAKAKAGESGFCAIPRFKPCDISHEHIKHPNGWTHGCRPFTECRTIYDGEDSVRTLCVDDSGDATADAEVIHSFW